jgi:isopenicillin N synthase-like dioxygenase
MTNEKEYTVDRSAGTMKTIIRQATDNTMSIVYSDFKEAEWIMKNCESIFSRLSRKWEDGEMNWHWLDGYNRERNDRNTFHWTCTTDANRCLGENKLPSDLICNWERWLEEDEQAVFRHFAIKAGSSLLDVLEGKIQTRMDGRYRLEVFRRSYVLCRIIEYPTSKQCELLALEHYDPSLLTLLYGGTEAGLEVKDQTNGWKAMPHGGNSYIINGRWLEYINRCAKAALHRVQNNRSEKRRYSLQCFLLVDTDRISMNEISDTELILAHEKIKSHYKHTFVEYSPTDRWKAYEESRYKNKPGV